ncbi:MAG: hypothetical protein QW453_06335 [Thermoprotei archaeon]
MSERVRKATKWSKEYGKILREYGILRIEEREGDGEPVLTITFEREVTNDYAEQVYWHIIDYMWGIIKHGYDHAKPLHSRSYWVAETWAFAHSSECSDGECPYSKRGVSGDGSG